VLPRTPPLVREGVSGGETLLLAKHGALGDGLLGGKPDRLKLAEAIPIWASKWLAFRLSM